MKRVVFFLIAVSLIFGCKPKEHITYVAVQDSTIIESSTEIEENPTWTNQDSALWYFAIQCDSAYNAILTEYNALNSGIKGKVEIKKVPIYLTDNKKVQSLQINIQALVDSIEIKNRTIRQLKNQLQIKPKIVEVEKPVKFTPRWKNICTWGFFIESILILLFLYLWIKKKFHL